MELNPYEVILLLLASIGPLKVMIVCASLTADASPAFLKKVAFRSVLIALIVCILFTVLGEAILRLFKVSVPAFQIGGGIIVLLFALDMVRGGKVEGKDGGDGSEARKSEPSLDCATFPLAIPLMASVSGLVAIVSVVEQRDDLAAILYLAGVIVAIMALNYVCLRSCKYIVQAVGPVVLQVVGKIMGVLMAALAVELILMGLTALGLIAKPAGRSSSATASPTAEASYVEQFKIERILSHSRNSAGPTSPDHPIKQVGTGSSRPVACRMQSSSCKEHIREVIPRRRLAHGHFAFQSTDRERDRCPLWSCSFMDAVKL